LDVLEDLYRAGSRWRVEFDGADWWSGHTALSIELQPRKPKEKNLLLQIEGADERMIVFLLLLYLMAMFELRKFYVV
jgi:hypothetical protein